MREIEDVSPDMDGERNFTTPRPIHYAFGTNPLIFKRDHDLEYCLIMLRKDSRALLINSNGESPATVLTRSKQ